MVDEFSSLELKRMLYLTRKRIRYGVSPALNDSAIFFKTGSLYKCKPEEGFRCGAYRGNDVNVLNALIVVETPEPPPEPEPETAEDAEASKTAAATKVTEAAKADEPRKTPEATKAADAAQAKPQAPAAVTIPEPKWVYLVAVMSNELKRNAATDHMNLATAIHELVTTEPAAEVGAEATGKSAAGDPPKKP